MKRWILIGLLFCIFGLSSLRADAVWVTIRADLSSLPSISPNGVHIVGPFNNYNPASDSMTAVGNGRFTATLQLNWGDYFLYKFVNGNAFGSEEGVFGSCAFNTYRVFEVPIMDTILPWACIGYCDTACTPAPGQRIACVGNSITWGYGLPSNILQSYPSILQDSLGPSYLVTNFGTPGAAVIRDAGLPYVHTDQFRHVLHYNPETVLLLLGANDSKSAIWDNWSANFTADYDSLCLALDTFSTHPRLVVCLPLTTFNPAGPLRDSVLEAAIVPQISAIATLRAFDQIDLRGFTQGLVALYPDGLHPGATATIMIANEVRRILQMPRPQIQQVGPDLIAPAGYGWQWYLNGDTVAATAGGHLQVFNAVASGDYKVGVRVDSLYHHVLISDSIQLLILGTEQEMPGLRIYPNPAKESLNWVAVGDRSNGEGVNLRLLSIDGRELLAHRYREFSGSISLHGISEKIILVEATTGGNFYRRVVLKQ